MNIQDEEKYLDAYRQKLDSFLGLLDATWEEVKLHIRFIELGKEEVLLRNGDVSQDIYYVCKGALRAYYTDCQGNLYTKNIFLENDVAGSMSSALLMKPSGFTLEALEPSVLTAMRFAKYKELLNRYTDLRNNYIAYLEQHWVIEKEQREISIVMEDAMERYKQYLKQHPDIEKRISQHHIASHLGITPTQLSRIRRKMKGEK